MYVSSTGQTVTYYLFSPQLLEPSHRSSCTCLLVSLQYTKKTRRNLINVAFFLFLSVGQEKETRGCLSHLRPRAFRIGEFNQQPHPSRRIDKHTDTIPYRSTRIKEKILVEIVMIFWRRRWNREKKGKNLSFLSHLLADYGGDVLSLSAIFLDFGLTANDARLTARRNVCFCGTVLRAEVDHRTKQVSASARGIHEGKKQRE